MTDQLLEHSRPQPGSAAEGNRAEASPLETADTLNRFSRQASDAIDEARAMAVARVGEAKGLVVSGLAEQQHAVADRIHRLSSMLHQASEDLRRDDPTVAHFVGEAGRRVESAASYARASSLDTVVRDVRELAQSRPAWVVGGAFVAGLALGRFLRSSGQASQGFGTHGFEGYERDAPRMAHSEAERGGEREAGDVRVQPISVVGQPERGEQPRQP